MDVSREQVEALAKKMLDEAKAPSPTRTKRPRPRPEYTASCILQHRDDRDRQCTGHDMPQRLRTDTKPERPLTSRKTSCTLSHMRHTKYKWHTDAF